MTQQLVERLEAEDLDTLRVAVESLAARVATEDGVRHVGVARSSDAVLLFVTFPDDVTSARVRAEVLDPWLGDAAVTGHARTLAEVTLDLSPTAAPDLDGPERLAAFIVAAASSGALWGLYGSTWARSDAAGEGTEALPVWPTSEQAARCIAGPWEDHVPRKIELEAYLEQWLTGMEEDGLVAVVHPTPTDPGVVVEPAELAALLRPLPDSD